MLHIRSCNDQEKEMQKHLFPIVAWGTYEDCLEVDCKSVRM